MSSTDEREWAGRFWDWQHRFRKSVAWWERGPGASLSRYFNARERHDPRESIGEFQRPGWHRLLAFARMARTWIDDGYRELLSGTRTVFKWFIGLVFSIFFKLRLGFREIVMRRDTVVAAGFLAVGWIASLLAPQATIVAWLGVVVNLGLFCGLCPLIYRFWLVRRFLGETAEYENLRAHDRPRLSGDFVGVLDRSIERYPFTAIVTFALAVGLVFSGNLVPIGASIRFTLSQMISLVPAKEEFAWILSWIIPFWSRITELLSDAGDEEAVASATRLWRYPVSLLMNGLIVTLGVAWCGLFWERHSLAKSLVVRPKEAEKPIEEQAHGEIVLERAARVGPACLGHLQSELVDPRWKAPSMDAKKAEDCRAGVAALDRIFGGPDAAEAWINHPATSGALLRWMIEHTGAVLRLDEAGAAGNAHRLAEAIQSLAAMVASAESLEPGLYPAKAPLSLERAGREGRALLQRSFDRSRDRSVVLLGACAAAIRLEELDTLERLTRSFVVSTNFKIKETDQIFEARDLVLDREEKRRAEREEAAELARDLGLERVSPAHARTIRFRRPWDGVEMVLIPSGSFLRGDDRVHDRTNSPRRRIHVGAFLIETTAVSRGAFARWVESVRPILKLDQGFFPVSPDTINWFSAVEYARDAIPGGRLPTEAEWEKAARGPRDHRDFPGGDNSPDDDSRYVSPYGVAIGHVLEWTCDGYRKDAYSTDPRLFDPRLVPEREGADRVVRGRSGGNHSLAERLARDPVTGGNDQSIGFRVVLPLKKEDSHARS